MCDWNRLCVPYHRCIASSWESSVLSGCACLCRVLCGPSEPAKSQADPEGCDCWSASRHAEFCGIPVSVTNASSPQCLQPVWWKALASLTGSAGVSSA